MKLNKKGFMMAEVIVVSAIIVIFLGAIYISYNKILSTYKTRINYYDNTTLYKLGYYRDTLIENNELDTALNNAQNGIVTVANNAHEKAYLIYNENKKLNGDELDSIEGINQTFKDYIKYLSTSMEFKTSHVMVGEKCNSKNNDDCQYSYLEIYDVS